MHRGAQAAESVEKACTNFCSRAPLQGALAPMKPPAERSRKSQILTTHFPEDPQLVALTLTTLSRRDDTAACTKE